MDFELNELNDFEFDLELDMNEDGVVDTYYSALDTSEDGYADTEVVAYDTNNSGMIDTVVVYHDSTGDGNYDTVAKMHDYDQDGFIDSINTHSDVNGDGQILYDTGFYFDTSPIFGYPPMKYFERTELKKLANISRIKMKPINGYKVCGSSKYVSKAKYLCLDNALMYVVYHEWKKALDELYEFTKYECKDAHE